MEVYWDWVTTPVRIRLFLQRLSTLTADESWLFFYNFLSDIRKSSNFAVGNGSLLVGATTPD
ncbi:MAG: hypothetical protein J6Y87_06040 [Muribaculaceae bacterium]|nr:hypothetical protein [Muribaculaceae bacterium]